MKKRLFLIVMTGVISVAAVFTLSLNLVAGEKRGVDNFAIILDSSASFAETYNGQTKLAHAKDIASRINRAVPGLKLNSELITFGKGNPNVFEYLTVKSGEKLPSAEKTRTVYGPGEHSSEGFEQALGTVNEAIGLSHLDAAIEAAGRDIESLGGNSAIIILSDGKLPNEKAFAAARNLDGKTCVYTIFVPSETADVDQVARDKSMLEQIANANGCGFSVVMDELASEEGVNDFVAKVFTGSRTPVETAHKTMEVKTSSKPTPDEYEKVSGEAPKYEAVLGKTSVSPATSTSWEKSGSANDSDGDGVSDNNDDCPGTPEGANVNQRGCWILGGVPFDPGKWKLNPGVYPNLDDIVSVLKKNPTMRVEIQGHTDSFGSLRYNTALSEKRAGAVMKYLLGKGIGKERLTSKGYGFSKPVATNDTPEGRVMNRRVELKPIQ